MGMHCIENNDFKQVNGGKRDLTLLCKIQNFVLQRHCSYWQLQCEHDEKKKLLLVSMISGRLKTKCCRTCRSLTARKIKLSNSFFLEYSLLSLSCVHLDTWTHIKIYIMDKKQLTVFDYWMWFFPWHFTPRRISVSLNHSAHRLLVLSHSSHASLHNNKTLAGAECTRWTAFTVLKWRVSQ